MKAQIVRIGNSQGVRIPKILLNESSLEVDVELEVCEEGILIRPAKNPRQNWDSLFREMADDDADEMLIEDGEAQGSFEKEEWRW
ncbi:MAG: AbrB/MazE/SpoVT family DNA-binding domain-containing protein [Acidobacteria bacterium]|nr:MAG: AbrB/MazE/SpoVT family DNA-binding domain-containing protein [Acidobacteriota bacterium]REK02847.1 MAG: AbrB/MazE/SpoVT family DNA-binding domain-containing protein [Acidobacteriota bacterium]REK13349.1 MAG: AbrB/MazE/SpoVT family DNA-binding domain-containing protein [Acidobacteriota bacterium]REK41343.1 MAG: AbrB/MazE/SpoVT family DNA-binding domain-containing protein [Acidobacteriota bacterium]